MRGICAKIDTNCRLIVLFGVKERHLRYSIRSVFYYSYLECSGNCASFYRERNSYSDISYINGVMKIGTNVKSILMIYEELRNM